MKAAIAKWGNSLALRLPKSVADNANLSEGTPVDLQVQGKKLIISAARPKYKLQDLLQKTNEKNRHAETDWGKAKGREAW